MPVIQARGRLGQDNLEFKASLVCLARPSLRNLEVFLSVQSRPPPHGMLPVYIQHVSSHFTTHNLETPSQTCPEVHLFHDSRSSQADSINGGRNNNFVSSDSYSSQRQGNKKRLEEVLYIQPELSTHFLSSRNSHFIW